MDGTMSNSFSLATADVSRFNDADGNPVTPPAASGHRSGSRSGEQQLTRMPPSASTPIRDTSKAAYVACAGPLAVAVEARSQQLSRIRSHPVWRDANCDPGTWYVVANNYPELPARRLARDGTLERVPRWPGLHGWGLR